MRTGRQWALERSEGLALGYYETKGDLPAKSSRQPGAAGLDSRLDGGLGELGGSGGR